MCTSSVFKPVVKLTRGLLGIEKPKAPPESEEAKEARRLRKEMMASEEEKQKQERQKDCRIRFADKDEVVLVSVH